MKLELPLAQMSVTEKLDAIEEIWSDLCQSPENIPSPSWHADVLAAREREAHEGKTRFSPLAEVRDRLLNA